jgi:hypothetical protein
MAERPGRHSLSTPGGQNRPAADIDAEATAAAIAGLRWRLLQCPDALERPTIVRELRKLEELIVDLLEQAGANPGRHRSTGSETSSQQISDADGFDLKPDPLVATTPAEFINILWRYRAWSGNPPWRKMAQQANQAVVHSTMHHAMNSTVLPKFDVVKAIIVGCGGSDDDLRGFTTAWRRLASSQIPSPSASGEYLTAPQPALRLVSDGGSGWATREESPERPVCARPSPARPDGLAHPRPGLARCAGSRRPPWLSRQPASRRHSTFGELPAHWVTSAGETPAFCHVLSAA